MIFSGGIYKHSAAENIFSVLFMYIFTVSFFLMLNEILSVYLKRENILLSPWLVICKLSVFCKAQSWLKSHSTSCLWVSSVSQSTVDKLIKKTNLALVVGTNSWREQFMEAITVSAGMNRLCTLWPAGGSSPVRFPCVRLWKKGSHNGVWRHSGNNG